MKEKSESAWSFMTCAVDNEFVKGYDRARLLPPVVCRIAKKVDDVSPRACTDTVNEHPSHELFKTSAHTHALSLFVQIEKPSSITQERSTYANRSYFSLYLYVCHNYLNLSK